MFKIGYEIECISSNSTHALEKLLRKQFKPKISVVNDPTIASTDKRPWKIEIVTPPLIESLADSLLPDIFDFCHKNDCVANDSTGFHVNISFEEPLLNKWLNPVILLNELDYDEILDKWGRGRKLYSRSFTYYFDKIYSAAHKKYKVNDWKDPYALQKFTADQVYDISSQKFISLLMGGDDTLLDKYNQAAYDAFDEKHICMNLGYHPKRGYIEFRMIGGKKYLTKYDDVKNDINEIKQAMIRAIRLSMDE